MILKSPSPEIDIPDISWPEYFLGRIQAYHDKAALIDGNSGSSISFKELQNTIHTVACSLQGKGYKKGDVFAIYAPNSPEYVITFQAILLTGGAVTTINPLYTANELINQLQHAKAITLFTVPELLHKVEPELKKSGIREIFTFNNADDPNSFEQLRQEQTGSECKPPAFDPENDIAVLPYSSGTTGLPKGVMISHRNLVAHNMQIEAHRDASCISQKDRMIAILPFFHIFGMTVNMNLGLSNGATLIIVPSFEPMQFLQLIEKYQITRAYLVPPIINFLANHPMVNDYDISSLNFILSGAAPLGAEHSRFVSERIDCPVVQGYGLTETSPVTHLIPNLATIQKPGSVGQLIPNTEAMIIDNETGKPVTNNTPGEILLRGPQVMLGYLDNPEATAETIDEEGWLHTGDIAYVDDDGFFYIVDRLKELIKYKAYQVAPAELEALLLTHPSIEDAAVIPSPDAEAGEIPKAFIVLKGELSPEAIMEWVAEKVAPYKKIRQVEFIDKIPKSASGKILRRELRDQHQ